MSGVAVWYQGMRLRLGRVHPWQPLLPGCLGGEGQACARLLVVHVVSVGSGCCSSVAVDLRLRAAIAGSVVDSAVFGWP